MNRTIRIVVVEDDESCTNQLLEYLNRYKQEYGEYIETASFSDGFELLENYNHDFDIILMDVQMPFVDGITAAGEIRKIDPEVVIIFITNMAQYAIRGYEVNAMDYVLKPVGYFAFSQRIDRAIMRLKKKNAHYLTIPVRGGIQKLDISQIYYIEVQNHTLVFHTVSGDFISTGTMKDIESKLQEMYFARGNNCYLINLRHVYAINDGAAVINGKNLMLSRSRKNSFMESLTNYIGEVM